jgi:hypothetical protein
MKQTQRAFGALTMTPCLAVAAIALLTAVSPREAAGSNPNPRILPVQSKAYGYTFGEWSADPNVLGVLGGGPGTAVADGFYLLLAPLPPGEHTIRIRGSFHFSEMEGDPFDLDLPSDVTFTITVGH